MGARLLADVKSASVYSSYGPSQSGSVGVLGCPHLGDGYFTGGRGRRWWILPHKGTS